MQTKYILLKKTSIQKIPALEIGDAALTVLHELLQKKVANDCLQPMKIQAKPIVHLSNLSMCAMAIMLAEYYPLCSRTQSKILQ